jgi:hypothetical protein
VRSCGINPGNAKGLDEHPMGVLAAAAGREESLSNQRRLALTEALTVGRVLGQRQSGTDRVRQRRPCVPDQPARAGGKGTDQAR